MTLCNSRQVSLGATRFNEQNVKTTWNRQMIGATLKPQDVYDSRKKRRPNK